MHDLVKLLSDMGLELHTYEKKWFNKLHYINDTV